MYMYGIHQLWPRSILEVVINKQHAHFSSPFYIFLGIYLLEMVGESLGGVRKDGHASTNHFLCRAQNLLERERQRVNGGCLGV